MRFLVLLLIVASRPLEAQVDSIRREGPFTPDTIREPEYSFTGHEDPLLLALGGEIGKLSETRETVCLHPNRGTRMRRAMHHGIFVVLCEFGHRQMAE